MDFRALPKGRPTKPVSQLGVRSQQILIAKATHASIEPFLGRINTAGDLDKIGELLAHSRVISASTDRNSLLATVGANVVNTISAVGPAHNKLGLINIASTGLSSAQQREIFPTISASALGRAQQLSFIALLEKKYPDGVQHARASHQEVQRVEQFWREKAAAPYAHGSTVLKDRSDPSSYIPKLLQRKTDEAMYDLYCFEMAEEHSVPRSKTFMLTHK